MAKQAATQAQVADAQATVAFKQYSAMVEQTVYIDSNDVDTGNVELADKWQMFKATFKSGMVVRFYKRTAEYAKTNGLAADEVELQVVMSDPEDNKIMTETFTGLEDVVGDAALMWVVGEAAYWNFIFGQRPRKNRRAETYVSTADVVVFTRQSRLVGIIGRDWSMKTRPHGMRG